MRLTRFASLLLLISLTNFSAFAQLPTTKSDALVKPDPEKVKAAQELEKNAYDLLDQAANEAAVLKLPENRALVYAMIGDLLWKNNEKRARSLYRDAANEIIAANAAPTANSEPNAMMLAIMGRTEISNLRRTVLQSLAAHDADFALELLQTTRPADIAAELQNFYAQTPAPDKNGLPKQIRNMKAEQEIQLEQSIVSRAADQDPQKAADLLRKSWAKSGVSYETMTTIYKVGSKDMELANKLLDESFQKLLDADFAARANEMSFALSQLNTFTSTQRATSTNKILAKLKVEDKTLKDLAGKIADQMLKASDMQSYYSLNYALPVLEKLVPEKVAQLKQKQKDVKKSLPSEMTSFDVPRSLGDQNATPEALIADAAKAPPRLRGAYYQQAASRAITSGNAESVRALLQNEPESAERDKAIATIDSALAAKLLAQGKTDEARKIIDRMEAGNAKVEQMVALAVTSYKMNTKESKEAAARLMEEAKQMVTDFPEDKDETEGLLKVVAGYVVIEPARAFTMLAPVIGKANDLLEASALLAKYNKQNQMFRNGELVMINGFASGGTTFLRYGRELKMLAETDFVRTRGLLDQFRRDDVRLFAKLFIAQGILKNKIGFDGIMPVFSVN